RHNNIINNIIDKSGFPRERVLNLNGKNSVDKLYASSKVDFFITDGATSSIYVSRFYQKYGICHSLAKSRIKGHIHGPAYHVNDSNVIDLNPEESWIFSKYSIDPIYFK